MIKINFKNGNFALLPEGDYQALYYDAQKKQVKAAGKPDSGVDEVRIDNVESISMINPNDLRSGGIILMQNGETETRVIEQGQTVTELRDQLDSAYKANGCMNDEITELQMKLEALQSECTKLARERDEQRQANKALLKRLDELTQGCEQQADRIHALLHRPFWLRVFNIDTLAETAENGKSK